MIAYYRGFSSLAARKNASLRCPWRFSSSSNNADGIIDPLVGISTTGHDAGECSRPKGAEEGPMCEYKSLKAAAASLGAAAEAELRAEVERDMRDGVAAIPPLPPLGWRVRHPSGSNYFVMTRTLKNGTPSAELHSRRYRSVHDTFLQSLKETSQRGMRSETRRKNSSGRVSRENAAGESHRDGDEERSTKVVVGYNRDGQGHRATLEPVDEVRHSRQAVRADVHLTVFAPFRVYDPSFHDSTVDICEWSCFDLVVQKAAGGAAVADDPFRPLPFSAVDGAMSMYVRLASVNSEMRIRSIQLLSMQDAQALVDHACFGSGEPLFLELLRRRGRCRPAVEKHFDDPRVRCGGDSQLESSLDEAAAVSSLSPCYGPRDPAFEMIMDSRGSAGEYGRALCYGGPYVSELSKEFCEVLLDYIKGDLGVSDQLCEYVCQMQFFLEQEEYVTWLGQLRHVANTVSRLG